MDKRKRNIRKLDTEELKTYAGAYKRGEVYKFAADEAAAELKRRRKGKKYSPRARQVSVGVFGEDQIGGGWFGPAPQRKNNRRPPSIFDGL